MVAEGDIVHINPPKRWLRDIGPLVAFDNATLIDIFPGGEVLRAEQAYKLLIA